MNRKHQYAIILILLSLEEYIMAKIIVEIDDSRAEILREKAKQFGLLPDQLVTASIEDLISRPESDFEEAMRNVMDKNKELYKRLA
jgi:hypothetical protein